MWRTGLAKWFESTQPHKDPYRNRFESGPDLRAEGIGSILEGPQFIWFRGRNWLALLTVNQGVASSSLAGTAKCIAEFLKKVHAWVGKGADHSAVGSSPTYASRLDVIWKVTSVGSKSFTFQNFL